MKNNIKNQKSIVISILTANFNNSLFLEDYFESILNQTFKDYEVIFIDDGSTDNSLEIASKFYKKLDEKLIIKSLEVNQGFANALNIGLSLCNGQYIARLDPDDVISPNRLEKQYQFLLNHPKYQIVGSNVRYFKDIIGNFCGESHFKSDATWIRSKYASGENALMHGTILLKKECFQFDQYYQENVPAEDYDLFSRLLQRGYQATNMEEPLTFVRIHGKSVSNFLPFTTIAKTHILKDQIFHKHTNIHLIILKYFHLKYYRKYLFGTGLLRFLYLLISVSFAPSKGMSVVLQNLNFFKK